MTMPDREEKTDLPQVQAENNRLKADNWAMRQILWDLWDAAIAMYAQTKAVSRGEVLKKGVIRALTAGMKLEPPLERTRELAEACDKAEGTSLAQKVP